MEPQIMNHPKIRKWVFTLLLVLVGALALTPVMDERADIEYEKLFQRAFITFALARTINGVISVVQGTEVALQPAGVGVTLTPGEILDPVNDLIERFSWIMMGATVSLGIQSVLLDVSAWWPIQGLVALLAAWLVIRIWYPGQSSVVTRQLLKRVLLMLLFIRFAVPLMLIANDFVYQQFLESRYQESSEIIGVAGKELTEISAETDQDAAGVQESGVFDSIAKAWSNTVDTLDMSGKVDRMQEQAGEVVEHLIQLSVIFILQTGLLPVAFLWVFLQVLRRLLRPIRAAREQEKPEP
jgi:hypothetical protein